MSPARGWRGPLPLLAAAALVGARVGLSAGLDASGWAVAAAGALGAVLLAVRLAPGALAAGVAALGLATGVAALAGLRTAQLESGPLWELATGIGSRPVVATVVAEARPSERGWWTLVRVERVGGEPARGRALLRGEDAPPPVLGTTWRGRAGAAPLPEEGFGAYLRRRHAAVALRPRSWRRTGRPVLALRLIEAARGRIRRAASTRLPPASAGLAAGLVTGDVRLLPARVEEAMRSTGLSHLTAVSGSNVAIAVTGALLAARLAGLGVRGRRRVVVATIGGFALLTRLEPSVLRAAVMALVVVVGRRRGVRRDARYDLAAALLLLVLADPMLAASLGLILSAAATAGVLVLAPLVGRRLSRLPARLGQVLAVTVGAQIAVAPVLVATQGQLPLASIPANLVAVPAAACASVVAGLAAIAAVVHPPTGALGFWLAGPPLAVIRWSARGFAGAAATVSWEQPTALAAVAALCWWLLSRSGSLPARLSAGLAGLAALAVLVRPLVPSRAPTRMVVIAIDVGQGDAVLVRAPGSALLVDGGPDGAAAGWLATHGPAALDLVVVSHPHADHVDGLPPVLASTPVGALWYRPAPNELASLDRLRRRAASRGVPVIAPHAGQRARVGELLVEVLSPPPGRALTGGDSAVNNSSLVLRVSWRGHRVLLTGDAEEEAQRLLLRRPGRLRAGVLKVPHHGAGTSVPELFAAVGARRAVISVGADNDYGHPDRGTLAALREAGASIHRTDREGTVRLPVPATPPGSVGAEPAAAPPPVGLPGTAHRTAVPASPSGAAVPAAAGGRAGRRSATPVTPRPRARSPPRRVPGT